MKATVIEPRRETVSRSDAPAARVLCEALEYETTDAPEFIDITDDVIAVVEAAGIQFGQVGIFSQHTTAAIKINEHEPLLLRDLARTLRQFAPPNAYYEHNDFSRRTVNIPDAYADARFNREVDKRTGYRTRSILCVPIPDSAGNTVAVAQLLNKCGRDAFDEKDEATLRDFAGSMGVILESWSAMQEGQEGGAPLATC